MHMILKMQSIQRNTQKKVSLPSNCRPSVSRDNHCSLPDSHYTYLSLSHPWRQAQLRDLAHLQIPCLPSFPPCLLPMGHAGLHIFPQASSACPRLGPLHLLFLLGTLFHQIFTQFVPSLHPCLCLNITS